ncbi:MAG: hypothetical protein BJ554DRAFT_2400, partial [Olpidium bornovanus]
MERCRLRQSLGCRLVTSVFVGSAWGRSTLVCNRDFRPFGGRGGGNSDPGLTSLVENVDEATPRVHSLVLAVPSLQEPNMAYIPWDSFVSDLRRCTRWNSGIHSNQDCFRRRSDFWTTTRRREVVCRCLFINRRSLYRNAKWTGRTGMCMSVKVVPDSSSALLLLTAYEIGDVVMWRFKPGSRQGTTAWAMGEIQLVWRVKCHPEPVMALACDGRSCFSGSADNRLVILGINTVNPEGLPEPREIRLKGMGVSDVRVRDDGRIVATAGWDGKSYGRQGTPVLNQDDETAGGARVPQGLG